MISICRKIAYYHSIKYLSNIHRSIYSGKVPQFLSNTNLRNINDGGNKGGYGEREICLFGPVDSRAPLPGNMGIPPFSLLYTDKICQLPKPAGDKCEVTSSQLPEERYQTLLTQAACVAAEKVFLSSPEVECVGFECPQLLKKDFLDLFPHRNLASDNLTVITLCQKTKNDMSAWSEGAELEREKLGNNFQILANAICALLKSYEYWADFIHPESGKPHLNSLTNATLFETDLRYRHFGFTIEDLGCCRIISHVMWGTHMYVGAIFTNAPLDTPEVQSILDRQKANLLSFNSLDL
ncbi:cobalamin trafficking protein CblD-like [Uloborus diversus]|uniref:cobalamin trafficking protein CblD-like n=1 Tax=Uloborus diversus TaxID=327109 RepID=UPI00240A698C|nr:cobalamin trafficking protein CblD-like [Uloborus diversus]